jgi:hypothetical protein
MILFKTIEYRIILMQISYFCRWKLIDQLQLSLKFGNKIEIFPKLYLTEKIKSGMNWIKFLDFKTYLNLNIIRFKIIEIKKKN